MGSLVLPALGVVGLVGWGVGKKASFLWKGFGGGSCARLGLRLVVGMVVLLVVGLIVLLCWKKVGYSNVY